VARPATLEERIRRLEDVVATLQDTGHIEERVVEKVSARLQRSAPRDGPEPTGILASARRKLMPAALSAVRSAADAPPQATLAGSPGDKSENGVAAARGAFTSSSRPWLLFDLYAELRTMGRMYVDRRYRMSWLARVIPLLALFVFLMSWFLFSGSLWGIGSILDKVIDLVLACVVYKVLAREVARYRQTVP
jgi:hypothetical protein